LANWIRSQGYHADPYPGPMAGALLLIPPAIAAGLGELGKHGSLISPRFGAGVRLAGVTTDMPLVPTGPVHFGADEFCATCQLDCSRDKQRVNHCQHRQIDNVVFPCKHKKANEINTCLDNETACPLYLHTPHKRRTSTSRLT
jgi:epoxyqueuosine reductase QueG